MVGKQGWRLGAVEKGNPIHHFLNIFDASLFTRVPCSLFLRSGIFPQKTAKQIHALQGGSPRSPAVFRYHQFSDVDTVLLWLAAVDSKFDCSCYHLLYCDVFLSRVSPLTLLRVSSGGLQFPVTISFLCCLALPLTPRTSLSRFL